MLIECNENDNNPKVSVYIFNNKTTILYFSYKNERCTICTHDTSLNLLIQHAFGGLCGKCGTIYYVFQLIWEYCAKVRLTIKRSTADKCFKH